jgi:hypothetical protein
MTQQGSHGSQPENPLGDWLSDPQVIAAVAPLIHAAVDERIAPLTAQVAQLTEGVTLMAQAAVEQARGQAQPEQPQYQQPPPQLQQPYPAQSGLAPQQPPQPMAPAQTAAVDKLAQFAPLLMQYLSGQSQQQSTNLSSIAETLSAAAQIGQFVNAPMWQGMKMATDMMSMSGRAGMDPVTAADTLGGMIDSQAAVKGSGDGSATP